MPLVTQGVWERAGAFRLAVFVPLLMLAGAVQLSGCTTGNLGQAAEIDQSLMTGNVPVDAGQSRERTSDEMTIRNAVSSADVSGLEGRPLAWANSDTGSRGAIESLEEVKTAGRLCRRFKTSRESFDGVALFKGETCMSDAGLWKMQAFEAL